MTPRTAGKGVYESSLEIARIPEDPPIAHVGAVNVSGRRPFAAVGGSK